MDIRQWYNFIDNDAIPESYRVTDPVYGRRTGQFFTLVLSTKHHVAGKIVQVIHFDSQRDRPVWKTGLMRALEWILKEGE